jgi:2-(1,2-epoxy-1,2-dihydrophenyl)acetyl-CoA isomerase
MAESVAEAQVLDFRREDGVAWIRLSRPEKMNAINTPLRRALEAAIKDAERDPEVRAVVLIGSGRAFCAGADVAELRDRTVTLPEIRAEYETGLGRLRTMPKPTIAAVNGVAAGIGVSLALACDLRYAAPEASFVEAFVNIGLTVDGGATWLLPRLVGTGRALELFYTGRPLGAEEAERWGLVNRVVPADQLEASVRELAQRLAQGPSLALGAIKRSVNYALGASFEETLDFEFRLQEVQMEHQDFAEGVAAFLEKRPARFQGR